MATIEERLAQSVLFKLQWPGGLTDEERLAQVDDLLNRARARQEAGLPPFRVVETFEDREWARRTSEAYQRLAERVHASRRANGF